MMAVYFIQECSTQRIKIGHSIDPERRLKQLQTGNGSELRLLGWLDGALGTERKIHEIVGGYKVGGEWYDPRCLDILFPDPDLCADCHQLLPQRFFCRTCGVSLPLNDVRFVRFSRVPGILTECDLDGSTVTIHCESCAGERFYSGGAMGSCHCRKETGNAVE